MNGPIVENRLLPRETTGGRKTTRKSRASREISHAGSTDAGLSDRRCHFGDPMVSRPGVLRFQGPSLDQGHKHRDPLDFGRVFFRGVPS